jgi:hypothetical protein
MRTLAFATLAFSLISGVAFADAIEVGNANKAPVFAIVSGDTSTVIDEGSASRAPVFDHAAGSGTLVTEIGTASRAPSFATEDESGASAPVAHVQPDGTVDWTN